MVDIQSAAAEIRRGKKERKKPQGKIIMAALYHRAAITTKHLYIATESVDAEAVAAVWMDQLRVNR